MFYYVNAATGHIRNSIYGDLGYQFKSIVEIYKCDTTLKSCDNPHAALQFHSRFLFNCTRVGLKVSECDQEIPQ